MWWQRKNVTHEEAEKENRRMFALEDREDDEFDEARIKDAINRIDWSFLDDEIPSESKDNAKKKKKMTKRKKISLLRK